MHLIVVAGGEREGAQVQVLYERCAGIDVHKDQVTVAVRLPGRGPGGRETRVRKFAAFYGVLREMAGWLASQGVTHVAMEATGIYTMPVYHALLEPGCFDQVLVCNAAHVKNVPGRKTDAVDASWLAELLECGLLKGSFIPPAQIKAVRDVVRYRRKIVQERAAETQRLGGVLQDAGIKLDSVASSIDTVSGLAMIRALIDGERRGQVLAELARGVMRAKIADLSHALEGRFGDHHALMCQLHLDHIAHLNEMIAKLDTQVEAMMVPFARQRDLLATIPGIGLQAAAAVISEIGPSPGEFFTTGAHLASWAGLCPGNHESAGKRKHGKPRKGSQHLQPLLVECAWSAVRTNGRRPRDLGLADDRPHGPPRLFILASSLGRRARARSAAVTRPASADGLRDVHRPGSLGRAPLSSRPGDRGARPATETQGRSVRLMH